MAIQFNDNLNIAAPKSLDRRYLNTLSIPYSSTTEVNSSISLGARYTGLTVNVGGVEYWYKDGVGDGDIVLKTTAGGTSNASGERIEKNITQASHGFSIGDVVASSGGTYIKGLAKTSFDGEIHGIVSEVPSTSGFTVVYAGYVTGLTSAGLAANTTYFASDLVAGDLAINPPSVSGSTIKPMLTMLTTDEALVFQYLPVAVSTGVTGGGGSGGIETGSNLGGGEGVFSGISGTEIYFKTLSGGSNIDVQTVGNVIVFSGGTGGGSTSPGGSNTSIQFNSGGTFGGDSIFTYSAETQSVTLGTRGVCGSSGGKSFAQGKSVNARGGYSHAEGYSTTTIGGTSHAEGVFTWACGAYSHAEGRDTKAIGYSSHAQGYYTSACGDFSFSSGMGDVSYNVTAHAAGTFNHSCIESQGGYVGTHALKSAILGGKDHNIEVGNTGAVIIGGDNILLTGTTYIDTTAVDNLAIWTQPTSGSSDQVLIRNTSTGIVEYVSKATIGGTAVINIYPVTGVSANTTLTASEYVVIADSTTTGFTITLPSSPTTGQAYKIKDNGNALTNNITIDGNGNNIDSTSTALINTDYGALEIVSDGTEWWTLAVAT